MSDFQELTNELMLDPEFKKEYESLQPYREGMKVELSHV